MSGTLVALIVVLAMLFAGTISFVLFAVLAMAKGTRADEIRSDRDQMQYLKDWQQRRSRR